MTGPERVRVTHPRTSAAHHRPPGARPGIDAHSEAGTAYLRTLMRAQGRLALAVLGAVAVFLGGLPLLFHLAPALRRVHVLGLPLPWLLLAIVVYPVLTGLGWWYVRRVEQNERSFSPPADEPGQR